MNKLIGIILILSVACAATESRIEVLGNNPFIRDINNITYCPSLLSQYRDNILIEIGESPGSAPAGQWGGAILGANDRLSVGLLLERPAYGFANVYAANGLPSPSNPIEIMGAVEMKHLVIGLGGYLARRNTEGAIDYIMGAPPIVGKTYIDSATNSGVYGGRAGLSLNTVEPYDVDVWLGLLINTFHNEYLRRDADTLTSTTNSDLSGSYTFNAGIRIGSGMPGDKINSSLYADYVLNPYTFIVETKTDTFQTDVSLTQFQLGLLGRFEYLESGRIIAGVGMSYASSKVTPKVDSTRNAFASIDETNTWLRPILNLGLEHTFRRWLTVRAGMVKYFGSRTVIRRYDDFYSRIKRPVTSPQADLVTLGFGFQFRGLQVDANISEELLFNAPHFISGNNLADNIFGKISVTYAFENIKKALVEKTVKPTVTPAPQAAPPKEAPAPPSAVVEPVPEHAEEAPVSEEPAPEEEKKEKKEESDEKEQE
jgi:hypothetical protein